MSGRREMLCWALLVALLLSTLAAPVNSQSICDESICVEGTTCRPSADGTTYTCVCDPNARLPSDLCRPRGLSPESSPPDQLAAARAAYCRANALCGTVDACAAAPVGGWFHCNVNPCSTICCVQPKCCQPIRKFKWYLGFRCVDPCSRPNTCPRGTNCQPALVPLPPGPPGQCAAGGGVLCVDPCKGYLCPEPTVCRPTANPLWPSVPGAAAYVPRCVHPCHDVACRTGSVCQVGADGTAQCVNPCALIRCASPYLCEPVINPLTATYTGTCVLNPCALVRCAAPYVCVPTQEPSGHWVANCVNPCKGVKCPPGQYCAARWSLAAGGWTAGCVDPCRGVVCPRGAQCVAREAPGAPGGLTGVCVQFCPDGSSSCPAGWNCGRTMDLAPPYALAPVCADPCASPTAQCADGEVCRSVDAAAVQDGSTATRAIGFIPKCLPYKPDPCDDPRACPGGCCRSYWDPYKGDWVAQCVDVCGGVACPYGQTCVPRCDRENGIFTGVCVPAPDPCANPTDTCPPDGCCRTVWQPPASGCEGGSLVAECVDPCKGVDCGVGRVCRRRCDASAQLFGHVCVEVPDPCLDPRGAVKACPPDGCCKSSWDRDKGEWLSSCLAPCKTGGPDGGPVACPEGSTCRQRCDPAAGVYSAVCVKDIVLDGTQVLQGITRIP